MDDEVANFRRQRLVEKLHRLGPRAVGEMLDEIGAERMIGALIDAKLVRYAHIHPPLLSALGGDRFPPAPLRAVPPEASV